jgi:nucleoside-diphosphate-sugar epimerase
MKIFITGGSGFLGGFLIEKLIKDGHKVKTLIRKTSNIEYIKNLEVELFYGSITDIDSLKEATKDIDIVIHLASLIHPVNIPDQYYYDCNVKGTENVFNAAYENNKEKLKQFIHCSSVTVYGKIEDENIPISENTPLVDQTTIYGVTKYKGELAVKSLAKEFNIPLTIVRPSRIYGERDTSFIPLVRLMKKRLFFNIGSGKTFMQPVHVLDCVQGILNAINNENSFGKVYNLAGPSEINKKEFLKIISKNLGKELPKFNLPIFVVKTMAITNEVIFKPLNKNPFISRKKLAFFLRSNKYDISAAKRDLNYNPKVDVQEGIKRMIDWYKKENLA